MATMVMDPICGVNVDPKKAISEVYNGKTYYLCCEACVWAFRKNPEMFLRKG